MPVAPDTSNMIPSRLTGKPFWQIYLYQDPPLWKAYIDAVKYFGFDSLMDGYFGLQFPEERDPEADAWKNYIVKRTDETIVTRRRFEDGRVKRWAERVNLYRIADAPVWNVRPAALGLPDEPDAFEPVEGVKAWPAGEELGRTVKAEMGDHGVVGVFCGTSLHLNDQEDILTYYDDPTPFRKRSMNMVHDAEVRFQRLMALPDDARPDFICCGASGTLVFQTPDMFRELGLPVVQKVTALCRKAGIPSHIHSCGPEKELVKICAEETDLTVIDPLEIPPMGDCVLADIKKLYGDRLVLKGNLHTTDVMLRGTPETVRTAAKQAIDDAAEGGRFILSTGDQCGRDTPDENIMAMIETARTYGAYRAT